MGNPAARVHFAPASGAADQIATYAAVFVCAKKNMAGLRAEMRQINRGHAVGCTQAQNLPRLHRHQAFARSQDGKGAQHPFAIKFDIPIHHIPQGRGMGSSA